MHTISKIPEPRRNVAAFRRPRRSGIVPGLEDIIGLVMLWRARSRQRRSLSKLDNHLLLDIGLTRDAAAKETAKPFWRA